MLLPFGAANLFPRGGLVGILLFMSDPQFAYPVLLDLRGRKALVVGGGKVALRKAQSLADAGAHVRVVSPEFINEFHEDKRLMCIEHPYHPRDCFHVNIVVAATDNDSVNLRVANDSRSAGALVNVVDRPSMCDFIVPAVLERGNLKIAISTSGAAPSLARKIRQRLEREFGPEYEVYLDEMARVRDRYKSQDLEPEVRRQIFERLSEDDIIAAAREGPEAVRHAIDAAVGEIVR